MSKQAQPGKYASRVRMLTPVHPAVGLVRALKTTPKTKKDGTPFTPWAEEAMKRIAKKLEREEQGIEPYKGRKCSAMTTGVHGPKRPCDRWAVNGLTVCYVHGASTKAAKDAARKRLLNELDPTIERLVQIRDQSDHMPSALGAATHIMNRVMGKPDAVDKDKGAGKPTIVIGVNIGGIPKQPVTVTAALTAASDDHEADIEADIVDEDE